jgi:hypothetical protein
VVYGVSVLVAPGGWLRQLMQRPHLRG